MTTALPPLCFVVMPFGVKPDGRGGSIDFDAVYERLIAPAIAEAKLQPLRGDQEHIGGMVHKPMFERLILSDYAVADLTTANANVFYELGVRHAVRPHTTVLIAADLGRTPFDLAPDRVRPYTIDSRGCPTAAPGELQSLVTALDLAREPSTDSPVFSLVDGLPTPEIDRAKTDVFRDQAAYSAGAKRRLADARHQGAEALREVEGQLGALEDVETGVVVDLLISYRAVEVLGGHDPARGPDAAPTGADGAGARAARLRAQPGRAQRGGGEGPPGACWTNAVRAARQTACSAASTRIAGRPSASTVACARADFSGRPSRPTGAASRPTGATLIPGVNAVTLMEMLEPGGQEQQKLVPVVRYAMERRLADGRADYWDHATRVELAVIARDQEGAEEAASDALAAVREPWEPESTANNLRLIREARAESGEQLPWAEAIEEELLAVANDGQAGA